MSTINCSSSPVNKQPEWFLPNPTSPQPELKVYNSMTRSLVPFIPAEGKLIRWYSCGPTVYDAAHIGHARNYMTFDIIRRLLRDYFNYDITYVMNITDIDDKIILRARQGYLLKEFAKSFDSSEDSKEALRVSLMEAWKWFTEKKFGFVSGADWKDFEETLMKDLSTKKEAGTLNESEVKKLTALEASSVVKNFIDSELTSSKFDIGSGAFAELLSPWLDELKGSQVTDQKIFKDLASYWEADFMEDMESLNVLPADYLTRVSEYVPEIVAYIEQIMRNGFAYESEGSVYFDVTAFNGDPEHEYAKLCPWSAGNSKFFEEGEGSLGVKLTGKRDPRDFALWKCSKPGEPFWKSPWGNGRPGWHIECSAMASSVLPQQLDIHSGGIDLAFPHHDNEIAQAEAHFHSRQWVNYFLHAGHVHIEGLKMSKSLKNFISIKEALKRYSSRQLRFLFLQHGWNSTLIYKESSMQAAIAADSTFTNFFANTQAAIEESGPKIEGSNDHGGEEKKLLESFDLIRQSVHVAICDSFDTPKALNSLLELISQVNVYMKLSKVSFELLTQIRMYVFKMYSIFGLESSTSSPGGSTRGSVDVLSVMKEVSVFRDSIREFALSSDCASKSRLLEMCDTLRKSVQNFGVIFEDRANGTSLVKLVDREQVARELAAAAEKEAEAAARKIATLKLAEEKAAAKAKKSELCPTKMFQDVTKYSKWDERGIPTHDAQNQELSKNGRKKCVKEFEAQEILYNNRNNKQ